MSHSIEGVSTAYDLWYDAATVDGHLEVTCWIAQGPRAEDASFDPRPGDQVLLGDDEEEPLPALVVRRVDDRVTVRITMAGASAVAKLADGLGKPMTSGEEHAFYADPLNQTPKGPAVRRRR